MMTRLMGALLDRNGNVFTRPRILLAFGSICAAVPVGAGASCKRRFTGFMHNRDPEVRRRDGNIAPD